MTKQRAQKEEIVNEVKQLAQEASCLVVSTYTGMNNADLYQLRSDARRENVKIKIVQNTLARIAFKDTDFEVAGNRLHGHLLYAFSTDDMVSAPRLLKKANEDFESLNTLFVAIEGTVYEQQELNAIAKLPNRNEALSLLAATLQAPYAQFVRTLHQIPQKLASTLFAITKK